MEKFQSKFVVKNDAFVPLVPFYINLLLDAITKDVNENKTEYHYKNQVLRSRIVQMPPQIYNLIFGDLKSGFDVIKQIRMCNVVKEESFIIQASDFSKIFGVAGISKEKNGYFCELLFPLVVVYNDKVGAFFLYNCRVSWNDTRKTEIFKYKDDVIKKYLK